MRKIFITTILVLCAICGMKAQSDTVTVHVDGTVSLESLMEGVWSQAGECLRLTGTPTEEDISYLKGNFANGRFNIYDLRHFELKRIPESFFVGLKQCTIILPECLEYIGGYAFNSYGLTVILTGRFPSTESCSFFYDYNKETYSFFNKLIASEDNPYCKNYGTYEIIYNRKKLYLESIYSLDESTLYYLPHSFLRDTYGVIEIIDGTKEIRGHGFQVINGIDEVILPESIETIKMDIIRNNAFFSYSVICNAKNPPTIIGQQFEIVTLYVPEESYDLYYELFFVNRHSGQTIYNCNGQEWCHLGIDENKVNTTCKVRRLNGSYIISSEMNLSKLSVYNIQGGLILQESIGGKTYSLNSTALPKFPLLLHVELENGHSETVKILP